VIDQIFDAIWEHLSTKAALVLGACEGVFDGCACAGCRRARQLLDGGILQTGRHDGVLAKETPQAVAAARGEDSVCGCRLAVNRNSPSLTTTKGGE